MGARYFDIFGVGKQPGKLFGRTVVAVLVAAVVAGAAVTAAVLVAATFVAVVSVAAIAAVVDIAVATRSPYHPHSLSQPQQ